MSHDFTGAAAPPAEGQRVNRRARPTSRAYRLRAEPYFILVHSPLSWDLVEMQGPDGAQWVWLPRLKRLRLTPGVNGVRQGRRGGAPDATLAIAQLQRRGWIIIPEEYDGGYVDEYPGHRGKVHVLKFETPVHVGAKTVLRCDEDAWRRWRLKLVEDGIVPPPQQEVLEAIMDRQRNRISRHERNVHIPAIAAKVEADVAKLDAMTTAAGVAA